MKFKEFILESLSFKEQNSKGQKIKLEMDKLSGNGITVSAGGFDNKKGFVISIEANSKREQKIDVFNKFKSKADKTYKEVLKYLGDRVKSKNPANAPDGYDEYDADNEVTVLFYQIYLGDDA